MSDPTPTLLPESFPQIPGFLVTGQAGRGGMGAVYRAQQTSTSRTVALKVLSRGSQTDAGGLQQFRGEAEMVARLEHPRIVPLYDYGEYNGAPYLAMRFLSGGTVADLISAGPIAPAQAVRWLGAVAEAIDYAHMQGVIHRDIKPSNMLLDEAKNAYLADFGIAGALQEVGEGMPTGSAAYMSPEQARGEPAGPGSDTYALAVSAFEMLTGRKPYVSETALGTLVRHMQDPIPSAHAIYAPLPQAVDGALAHGMAKNPDERPESAAALIKELAWAVAQPVQIEIPAEAPRRRGLSPWLVLGVLAVLGVGMLVLLGAGVAGYAFLSKPGTATPTSTLPPTLEPQATAVAAAVALPFTDDFSDPESGFALRSADDGSIGYQAGQLQFNVEQTGSEFVSKSGRVSDADVFIQVTYEQVNGPLASEIGLVCRLVKAENSYVAAAISASGNYRLWQVRGGETQVLVDWTAFNPLDAPNQGRHTLSLTCRGADVALAFDGNEIGRATDGDPQPGDVGLLAGLSGDPPLTVNFDDLLVTR